MADSKKISELHKIQNLNNDDEFIVVDKSTQKGVDASTSGKTSRVTFDQLKTYIGSQGPAGETGPAGPKGEASTVKGPRGTPGADSIVPGPKGVPSTVKGPRGDVGADSTVKGPRGDVGADSNVAGPQGNPGGVGPIPNHEWSGSMLRFQTDVHNTGAPIYGDYSQSLAGPSGGQGDAGPKGQRGSVANANAHLGLKGPNCAMSFHGHHIYKINGNPNSWDAAIYSQQSYTGGCILSFRPATTDAYMMIGINGSSQSDPVGSPSYQSLDYAFYCAGQSDDRILIYESGKSIKEVGKFTTSTVFTIKYDGSQIHYYVDGDEVHTTVAPSTSMKFHMDSSIVRPVSTSQPLTSLLSFIPLEPGPPGPASTEKGPKGDVGATFSYNPTTKVLTIT